LDTERPAPCQVAQPLDEVWVVRGNGTVLERDRLALEVHLPCAGLLERRWVGSLAGDADPVIAADGLLVQLGEDGKGGMLVVVLADMGVPALGGVEPHLR